MSVTDTKRVLLLTGQAGERQFHNEPRHWANLAAILRLLRVTSRTLTDDLTLLRADLLAAHDVILNFSTDLTASADQIAALDLAVRAGVGFVGLHAATATFRDSAVYHALIGSRFASHPPIKEFTVEVTAPEHPVVAGVPNFTITDERYELKDMLPDARVLAQAEGQAMVYVRQHGAGRVCYIAPGHDERSLAHPAYAQLVSQAVAWAARTR